MPSSLPVSAKPDVNMPTPPTPLSMASLSTNGATLRGTATRT